MKAAFLVIFTALSTRQTNTYFVGLDLGQSRDYSAIAVVERAELFLDEMDWVKFERQRAERFRVKLLRRVPLGTPYPDVVERVREVARRHCLAGRCRLVLDATGVGAPVLDMLRRAGLGCPIDGVILTGGDKERRVGGMWHVPKRDLVTGLRVMLEREELRLSKKVRATCDLDRELGAVESRVGRDGRESFGAWRAGEHDDLVMATALACWRARMKEQGVWGTRSLGL